MADLQPITEFIFNNRSRLNLNVLRLTWPQAWGLDDFHDMEVNLSFDGIQSNGRGQFSSEETSFEIAASEALERYTVKALGLPHSYGIACHSNKEKALANSIRELLEREIFFRFFYEIKTFNLLDVYTSQMFNISDNASCKKLLNQLTKLSLNVEFWEIGKTQLGPVIMCVAQGNNDASILSGGASFGLALCENQGASILKSLIEVSCKIAFIKQYKLTKISEIDFLENQNKSSDLRQRLLLDRNYFESFKNSLSKGESTFDYLSSLSMIEATKSVLLSIDSENIINKAPVYIYQSFFQSESAYLGKGNVLKIAEQNKPHFLG